MLVNGVFVMVPAVSFCNMRHSQKKERLHAIKDDVHKEKMCTLEEKMQELEILLMVRWLNTNSMLNAIETVLGRCELAWVHCRTLNMGKNCQVKIIRMNKHTRKREIKENFGGFEGNVV